MPDHDEALLRRRKIVSGTRTPPAHQALRIAIFNEYAARAFHTGVIGSFGDKTPFPAALRACEQRIAQGTTLCRRLGVPRPPDSFPAGTRISLSWRENCERAANGEITRAGLYASLLPRIGQADVCALLARWQRDSVRRQYPAFIQALATAVRQEHRHASHGIAPEEAYMQHGPLSDFVEKAFSLLSSQHGALGVAGPLLRQLRPAMVAGLLAGSAGGYLAGQRIHRDKKDR